MYTCVLRDTLELDTSATDAMAGATCTSFGLGRFMSGDHQALAFLQHLEKHVLFPLHAHTMSPNLLFVTIDSLYRIFSSDSHDLETVV